MSTTLVIIEATLIFGGLLGFCFWELYKTKRDLRREAESEDLSRHPEGE